jgi:hypothetical protein
MIGMTWSRRRCLLAGLAAAAILVTACEQQEPAGGNFDFQPSYENPEPRDDGSGSFDFQPGYENPAPGDDGSWDCAPGQGPVPVGPDDPNGLDGDGDGIGCE